MQLGKLLLSMRLATLTVSPRKQYRGHFMPITPAYAAPQCTPGQHVARLVSLHKWINMMSTSHSCHTWLLIELISRGVVLFFSQLPALIHSLEESACTENSGCCTCSVVESQHSIIAYVYVQAGRFTEFLTQLPNSPHASMTSGWCYCWPAELKV